jgi:hypothetical protein
MNPGDAWFYKLVSSDSREIFGDDPTAQAYDMTQQSLPGYIYSNHTYNKYNTTSNTSQI